MGPPARQWRSGRGLVEGDRPGLEALTRGVRPRPAWDAEVTGRSLHRPARWDGPPAAVEAVTPVVGEDDPVGIIGVAGYAQMAEVV